MRKLQIRYLLVVMSLLMALVLPGCQILQPDTQDDRVNTSSDIAAENTTVTTGEKKVFRVVVNDGGMVELTEKLIEQFEENHPELTVELQVLPITRVMNPENTEIRELQMQRLRTQIMAGDGPDVYLMPSAAAYDESLFWDVQQSMRNGIFADISKYYDADTELNKQNLVTPIMDAGVIDGARYVLPLFYEMPVAYVDVEQFEAEGGTMDMFNGTITDFHQKALSSGNPRLATGVTVDRLAMRKISLNFIPELIDYTEQELLVTKEDIVPFLENYQTLFSLEKRNPDIEDHGVQLNSPGTLERFISNDGFWNEYRCMYIGLMQDMIDNIVFSKAFDVNIEMYPVAASDGDVVADVSFYGAVDGNCDDPALAYEFLRMFLTKEAQWTGNRVTDALKYIGWPVYANADTDALNAEIKDCVWQLTGNAEKKLNLGETKLTDEDLLDLYAHIDRVQFTSDFERAFFYEIIDMMNNGDTGEVEDFDIKAGVEKWLDDIDWFLAES